MKNFLLLLSLFLLLTACGGRVPSPGTAQNIIKHHFNDYGNKYPTTVFGNRKVQKVEILSMEEIQRHVATAVAMVDLENGTQVKIQMNFLNKPPLGWRSQGWEKLDATEPASP